MSRRQISDTLYGLRSVIAYTPIYCVCWRGAPPTEGGAGLGGRSEADGQAGWLARSAASCSSQQALIPPQRINITLSPLILLMANFLPFSEMDRGELWANAQNTHTFMYKGSNNLYHNYLLSNL